MSLVHQEHKCTVAGRAQDASVVDEKPQVDLRVPPRAVTVPPPRLLRRSTGANTPGAGARRGTNFSLPRPTSPCTMPPRSNLYAPARPSPLSSNVYSPEEPC